MAKARLERDGELAIVTLCNPPLNLVGSELLDELEHAVNQLHLERPRAVLLRAEGENFSAGAQVDELFQGRSADDARELLSRIITLLARFERIPMPSVAAVNGMCLAAGLEMVLACDIAWAGESARLGLVEGVIGATPFGGGTQRLAERAGVARAREIIMTAEVYDAATFERWNIVNRVLPDAELHERSLELAHRLASGPTCAHKVTKRVLREYLDHGAHTADAVLPGLASPLFETEDMQNGLASLLERGPGNAKFSGK